MMKLLAVSALICATMVLSTVAIHPPDIDERLPLCPRRWTNYKNQCFYYVSKPMTWAEAQKNCLSMNANLASVHSLDEYERIQKLIYDATRARGLTWIGGSDAQQDGFWFWINGNDFTYDNWCPGEPNNLGGNQACIQMNHSDKKCWDDQQCDSRRPSVCAKNYFTYTEMEGWYK